MKNNVAMRKKVAQKLLPNECSNIISLNKIKPKEQGVQSN